MIVYVKLYIIYIDTQINNELFTYIFKKIPFVTKIYNFFNRVEF